MLESNKTNQPGGWGFRLLRKFGLQRNSIGNPEIEKNEKQTYNPVILSLYRAPSMEEIAQITLDVYNVAQDGPCSSLGTIHGFKIVWGDLWDQWNEQTAVILINDAGQEVLVKIAALPVEEDGLGLIEFISDTDLKDDKLQQELFYSYSSVLGVSHILVVL